jgi:hypothetical protein
VRKWLLFAGLVTAFLPRALGCMALAPGEAEQLNLDIAGEQAVIIWDSARHIEHFIRQANIDTKGERVAFLVPTPEVPELAEADPSIFKMAADVAYSNWKPYYDYKDPFVIAKKTLLGPLLFPFVSLLTGMSERLDTNPVLAQSNVGDYQATILRADARSALLEWLRQHGFALNQEEKAWLEPYIQKKWKITAFELSGKPRSYQGITSRAIRMSFASPQPFFPYSEPHKPRPKSGYYSWRTLSVAILSDERMDGKLMQGMDWPTQLRYAGSSDPKDVGWKSQQWLELAGLSKSPMSVPKILTYFRDSHNPRVGNSDLVFSPNTDQSPFRLTETDYGDRRYRINWSEPIRSVLGLATLIALVVVPMYCGARGLVWLRREARESRSKFWKWTDLICGLVGIATGIVEFVIYVSALPLLRALNPRLDGTLLPALTLDMPVLSVLFVFLFLAGRRLILGDTPTSKWQIVRRCTYSVGAITVGLLCGLWMLMAIG